MSEVAVRGGGEMVKRTPSQEMIAVVRSDEFQSQLAMALPENVPASRFQRAAATALMADPKLADGVNFDSFVVALMRSAQAGLLPDGKEAAIVRYGDKATFLAMIGGIRKVAAEYGWTIDTKVVRANDEFDYELGMEPRLVHRPALGERGDLRFAYAVARHRDGRREIEVMDAGEIAKVRKSSRASSKGPWVDWEERMWEKSVGHRISKRLPLDPGDKRVAFIIDAEELGPDESARLLYGPGGATFTAIEAGTEGQAHSEAVSETTDAVPAAVVSSPSSQQAAEGEVVAGDDLAANGAPSVAPGTFQIPDAVVDAAGKVEVQTGWTVAQVCGDEKGREWAAWALGPDYDGTVDAKILDALQLYVGQKHPEMIT